MSVPRLECQYCDSHAFEPVVKHSLDMSVRGTTIPTVVPAPSYNVHRLRRFLRSAVRSSAHRRTMKRRWSVRQHVSRLRRSRAVLNAREDSTRFHFCGMTMVRCVRGRTRNRSASSRGWDLGAAQTIESMCIAVWIRHANGTSLAASCTTPTCRTCRTFAYTSGGVSRDLRKRSRSNSRSRSTGKRRSTLRASASFAPPPMAG